MPVARRHCVEHPVIKGLRRATPNARAPWESVFSVGDVSHFWPINDIITYQDARRLGIPLELGRVLPGHLPSTRAIKINLRSAPNPRARPPHVRGVQMARYSPLASRRFPHLEGLGTKTASTPPHTTPRVV